MVRLIAMAMMSALMAGCVGLSSSPPVVRNVAYYQNGTLEAINYTFVNDENKIVFHGTWTEWYPNGREKFQRDYSYDRAHGRWVQWTSQGSVEAVWEYDMDDLMGLWVFWSEPESSHFGRWTSWKNDRGRATEVTYRADRQIDPGIFWIENDDLIAKGEYRDGKEWRGAFYRKLPNAAPDEFIAYYDKGMLVSRTDVTGEPLP